MPTTTSSDVKHVRTALRIGGATVLAFLALLSVWASVRPAAAERSLSAGREQVRQALAEKFGEAPVALGLVDRDTMIEVFAGSEGATLTIRVKPGWRKLRALGWHRLARRLRRPAGGASAVVERHQLAMKAPGPISSLACTSPAP